MECQNMKYTQYFILIEYYLNKNNQYEIKKIE